MADIVYKLRSRPVSKEGTITLPSNAVILSSTTTRHEGAARVAVHYLEPVTAEVTEQDIPSHMR